MFIQLFFHLCQFSSVQLLRCVWLCHPMDYTTPGLPVHHQLQSLLKFMSIKSVMAIQPSHPLLSFSPAFNLSWHQGLFKWVSSLHQVTKVLSFSFKISPTMNTQDWSPLGWRKHKRGEKRIWCRTISLQFCIQYVQGAFRTFRGRNLIRSCTIRC